VVQWVFPDAWSAGVMFLAEALSRPLGRRFVALMAGVVLAKGRRTVTSWLRAIGVGEGYSSFYYGIGSLGHHTVAVANQLWPLVLDTCLVGQERVIAALDDSPTRRYGPHVEGAHH
jgi:hypothetical protein